MVSATNTIASSRPILTRPAGGWRLHSSREIAVYIRCEVRTVQRWEKREGMPVHRHRHTNGNTVYAFREEIGTWLIAQCKVSDSREQQRCLFC